MRASLAVAFALILGCSSPPTKQEKDQMAASAPSTGVSNVSDYRFLEDYSGKVVTITGRFEHENAIHGIVVLDSGLRITIPHFDQYMQGEDWLKYVGHRCAATGILHTWTKNLPAYHGATLQFIDFSGSTSE